MAAIASSSTSSIKSLSPSPNLSLLLSNLNAFVSVKLDASNFIIWRNQWQNILKATGLYSFVDGTGVAPSTKIRDSTNQEVTNPEFLQWMVDDAHLMSCISGTLSSAVYPVVINCGSSLETWSNIEKRFTSLSRSHIHQLKNRLTATVKGSNTMDVYLQQIKNLNDQLTLAGSQVDSEDLVLITLNGLSDDYRAFKTSIRTRSTPITMEELCALLLSEAIHEETSHKSHSSTDLNVAFVASRGSYTHQGNRGNYSAQGNRGSYSTRGGYRGNFRSNTRGNYSNKGYSSGRGNFRGGTKPNYTGHSQGTSGYTQGSQGSGFSSGSSGSSSGNVVCQICDKPGHTAFDCWHRLNMDYQPNSSSGSYAPSSNTKAYVATVPEQTNTNWYVDSAASTHITNDLSSLSLYEPYQGSEQVTVGNGTTLPIHNTGNAVVVNLIHPQITVMVEEGGSNVSVDPRSAEEWLSRARDLVPVALQKAREVVKGFQVRWKVIISKIEQIPPRLSDLATHPFFSKNTLCIEQLQSVSNTLNEAIQLSELCLKGKYEGKLRMQSDLDMLSGKLDLNLKDLGSLIKTGVLSCSLAETEGKPGNDYRELLARLQIGQLESKHKALDSIAEALKEDEKTVLGVIGRGNIAALVQLLTAGSSMVREKAVLVICSIAECGSCENWLVEEGGLPPLIRLVESGSAVGKEKATISLQRLSMSSEAARSIVGHGGVRPLIEVCRSGDPVARAAAACTLKNISVVPEVRQNLAEEGIIKVLINLLDCGTLLGSKEYAAECLQNLTSSNENLRRNVVSEGGIRSLLGYLNGPLPQESAVGALRNLISSVSADVLVSLGLIPRLVHVLKSGSLGAQIAAASAVCRLCSTRDMKKLVGENGCIPLLVKMLESKSDGAREVAAQAISSLVAVSQNKREVKRDEKSVPSLVQLLDPSPQNAAKKYAVSCLGLLSSSKKCKKLMVSYGAIGYLKKLSEMDVSGAKKLLERLERGKLRNLLSRK